MCHTSKNFIHMQYLSLLTDLVIAFVHWVTTGVRYEPRQCSLFCDYIIESKPCFASICAARPVHIPIKPIQKLLLSNNDVCVCKGGEASNQKKGGWGATKNSAVALSSRNDMISIFTRGARGRMKAKQRWFKVTREMNCVVNGFIMFGIMFMTATGLQNSPQSFDVYTVSQSRPW